MSGQRKTSRLVKEIIISFLIFFVVAALIGFFVHSHVKQLRIKQRVSDVKRTMSDIRDNVKIFSKSNGTFIAEAPDNDSIKRLYDPGFATNRRLNPRLTDLKPLTLTKFATFKVSYDGVITATLQDIDEGIDGKIITLTPHDKSLATWKFEGPVDRKQDEKS